MRFKQRILSLEFQTAPRVLKAIALDADGYCRDNFKKELIVTRILEKFSGESGVHLYHRAIDYRNEQRRLKQEPIFRYTPDQVDELLDYINKKYPRRDKYVVLLHHSFKGGPKHFHMQIPYIWAEARRVF